MSSLEPYLDQVCAQLNINPAKADDIKEELTCHLEELIATYCDAGMSRDEAEAAAIAWFGDTDHLHDILSLVHSGETTIMRRLKAASLGSLFGVLIALVIPLHSHLLVLGKPLPTSAWFDASRASTVVISFFLGAVVGLLATRRRSPLFAAGLCAIFWLCEYALYWLFFIVIGSDSTELSAQMLRSLILAPFWGAIFGAVVFSLTSISIFGISRGRPEIR